MALYDVASSIRQAMPQHPRGTRRWRTVCPARWRCPDASGPRTRALHKNSIFSLALDFFWHFNNL